MKRARVLVFTLFIILTDCVPPHSPESGKIVPSMDETRRVEQSGAAGETRGDGRGLRPLIRVSSDDRVISILNGNLDSDPDPEQVIAVKSREDVNSPIRIIVADFDSAKRGHYFQSWEAPIGAVNPRTFRLSLEDMEGDHGLEIVAGGTDGQGKSTLDVLRRNTAVHGQGVSFHSVCQITADDVRIERTERSESYSSGQKNGESFSISAFSRDPESKNVMDLIRVPYTWTYAENRFVQGRSEKIAGEKVQQRMLESLYTNESVDYFEAFLDGAWIVLDAPAGAPAVASGADIIFFEPKRRRISRYLGDTVETYAWTESYRTIYNSLRISAQNEAVRTIDRTFYIRATSMSTLEISIQGSDMGGDVTSAVYAKMSDEIQGKYLMTQKSAVTIAPPTLDAVYRNASGVRIAFEGTRITWSEGSKERSGVFAMLSVAGRNILSIRFTDPYGPQGETRNYILEYGEKRERNGIVKTIMLSSVQFSVNGLEETMGDPIVLQKIEQASKR